MRGAEAGHPAAAKLGEDKQSAWFAAKHRTPSGADPLLPGEACYPP
ncbi:MAG: hypothetical protein ACI9F9_002061 [Candidatus Paceibacteria bacterium]|jgi:hypothetical protein